MKYAVIAPVEVGVTANPQWMAGFAKHLEVCGFESVVAVEHTIVASGYASQYPYDPSGRMGPADDCPFPDPLDLLAFLAGQTTTLGLATGVSVLPNHHPVVFAKRAATIDALSEGRLRLCVGAGWMREEVEACGVDFATRGRRMNEQIDVLRTLWRDRSPEGASFSGEYFQFSGAMSYPKPARDTGIPIHIGGHSRAAARRAGRRGDGLQPLGVRGDELRELVEIMRTEADKAGRDPEALELTLGHSVAHVTPEKAESLARYGANRVKLALSGSTDLEEVKDELSACAERLGLSGREG